MGCSLCGNDAKCDCDKLIKVYFCPKCKTHNVRYIFELSNLFGIIPKMKCLNCGFSASGFPVIVTSRRKVSEMKNKKRKKVKKNGGRR